ncbi:MAG: hypothetical protein IJT73_05425, partial [Selenomonadaceae bacterium]|nr:hypothetical protein [Selenomonadaceae bacterium]
MSGLFDIQRFADDIYGTIIDDKIKNTVSGIAIYALGRNDSIYNSGANVTIYGGDGDDTILNQYDTFYNHEVIINGDNGND